MLHQLSVRCSSRNHMRFLSIISHPARMERCSTIIKRGPTQQVRAYVLSGEGHRGKPVTRFFWSLPGENPLLQANRLADVTGRENLRLAVFGVSKTNFHAIACS